MAAFLLSTVFAGAQFRDEAFSQQYNSDPADKVDTTDVLFSLKDYIGGLKHQKEIKMGTMAMGSAVLIGGCQIYNKQYWKLPIVAATNAVTNFAPFPGFIRTACLRGPSRRP